MDTAAVIALLGDKLEPFAEPAFRSRKLAECLARFTDEEIAETLEQLYRGAILKRKACLELLEALWDIEPLRTALGGRLSDIFDYADRNGLILAAEWLVPLPLRVPTPKGLKVHTDLAKVTLGERKWLARKATPRLLEKLLVDPDPTVIRNLLNHPRLLEHHVLKICAKRPNHPEILREIGFSQRWSSRYEVKKAILNNPASPPRLIMLILPQLTLQDLRDLLNSTRFSPGFIHMILDVRLSAGTEDPDPAKEIDLPPSPEV